MNKLFQLKIEREKWKVMILNGHSERSEESQGFKVDSSGKTLRMTNLFDLSTLKTAFTLAEVLITLVIIGVVAAVTVPIMFNNTNDKEYNVAKQKAKATIGEAFKLMTINGEIDKDKSTKEIVEEVLPKYLKLSKTCDNAKDCGFSDKLKRPDGKSIEMPLAWSEISYPAIADELPTVRDTWGTLINYKDKYPLYDNSYFFKTLDGFSVNFFYNPYCVSNKNERSIIFNSDGKDQLSMDVICFNAIYDMNGTKGPNTVGKDIGFVGSFYNGYESSAEAVLPYKEFKATNQIGSGNDHLARAFDYCQNIDNNNSWILPNIDELSLIYLNKNLILDDDNNWYWSRSLLIDTKYYLGINFHPNHAGARHWRARNRNENYVICTRNNALK